MQTPLSAAPEPKRRFVPSKSEHKKVMKMVRAIRKVRRARGRPLTPCCHWWRVLVLFLFCTHCLSLSLRPPSSIPKKPPGPHGLGAKEKVRGARGVRPLGRRPGGDKVAPAAVHAPARAQAGPSWCVHAAARTPRPQALLCPPSYPNRKQGHLTPKLPPFPSLSCRTRGILQPAAGVSAFQKPHCKVQQKAGRQAKSRVSSAKVRAHISPRFRATLSSPRGSAPVPDVCLLSR